MRTFDELVADAVAADVSGWDFGWLHGRASEQRPSRGYQRLMSERLTTVEAALDVQTGGGEVLARATRFPPTMVATESWPPNPAATPPADRCTSQHLATGDAVCVATGWNRLDPPRFEAHRHRQRGGHLSAHVAASCGRVAH